MASGSGAAIFCIRKLWPSTAFPIICCTSDLNLRSAQYYVNVDLFQCNKICFMGIIKYAPKNFPRFAWIHFKTTPHDFYYPSAPWAWPPKSWRASGGLGLEHQGTTQTCTIIVRTLDNTQYSLAEFHFILITHFEIVPLREVLVTLDRGIGTVAAIAALAATLLDQVINYS